ncbi:Abi-alpha family protein [Stenotrophobium rhamnosiphilum]|uniref:Abi-alpha family protein n=1 Tax=Stenotrophobium rhamnosiphilum TaxID=2029166 RepID=UPI001375287C|nr:Abi-alpha family protein [Stenotrophobium rhamnosiphilum]
MKSLPKPSLTNSLVGKLLQRVPGGEFAQEQLEKIENRVLQELKGRLDQVDRGPSVAVLNLSVTQRGRGKPRAPSDLLRDLLDASNTQSRDEALTGFHARVLASLLPDEARILSLLSDGRSFPLINISAGTLMGFSPRTVEEGISSLGKYASVRCPELVPVYIQRLKFWGLVQIEAEDSDQETEYQMLEADDVVRKVIARIEEGGERARIARRALKISDIGRTLWFESKVAKE